MLAIYDAEDMASLDVPWWTYGAAARVEEFLAERPGARVFEWGSGASTTWLGRRAAEVISIEHDAQFVGVVQQLTAEMHHVTVRSVPGVASSNPVVSSDRRGAEGVDFSDYVASLSEAEGKFDLIVVDGRARVACLEAAADRLAIDGMLVFDNADRRRYATGLSRWHGRVERISGAAPALPYRTCTAILTR